MSEFGMLGLLAEIEDEMGVNAPASVKSKIAKAKTQAMSVKPTTSGVATAQSRAEMMDKFALLPKEIQAGLSSGKLQMTDHVIYATKSVSGATTVKLFEDSDSRMVGVCNISKAKMEKNEFFLLSGIRLLQGTGTGTTADKSGIAAITTDWDQLEFKVKNGEFTFRVSQKTLIDRMSMLPFANYNEVAATISNATPAIVGGYGYAFGSSGILPGFVKLANTKLITPDESIEMNLEWVAAAATNSFIRVELYGTRIIQY